MRSVVNISLPKKLNDLVRKEIKSGRYTSKSEFFRELLRLWEEKKIINELEESRRELKMGLGKILKSVNDLD